MAEGRRTLTDDNHARMSTQRASWHRLVEAETYDYREEKARGLELVARDRMRRAKLAGKDSHAVSEAGRWHKSRAQGARFRFASARNCGNGPRGLQLTCQACGLVTDRPLTCGATLVCLSCRGRLQGKRRELIAEGIRELQRRATLAGLLRTNRKGGRWSHKMVTLTIPHEPHHTIGDRIEVVHRAWPHFLKAFNAWLRTAAPRAEHCSKDAACGSCEACLANWYGSHEWTIGSDERGHPHVHFWFFGPFVDVDVEELWRSALERVGLPWEGYLDIDVQEARNMTKPGGVYELVKYVVKDIAKDGKSFVDAEHFADLYEALDGRRLRRGSAGFIAFCERAKPCACGVVGCRAARIVERRPEAHPSEDVERQAIIAERGPP
jgi:hypothetical protein